MPIRDTDTTIYEYPSSKLGVNIYSNIADLNPEECLLSQNAIWNNGMKKRGGQDIFETDEVQASKQITGLHRFYYSQQSKQLLAASGTAVRYHTGATWADVQTGLNDGAQVHFATWGALQKTYFANGNDELYSWDGSSAVTLSGGNIPTSIIQVLPYQDRLLAIDNTNHGTLSWSDAFSTTAANWVPASSTGVRPDSQLHGMINHSINNSDAGYESAALLAGSNGMYLFAGTDLRAPATTGNYTIFPLATKVGCNAPRTMQWTPKGSIYLGIDKNVYLLPFKSSTPIPISQKLFSTNTQEGLEKIPSGQIQNACAVYHDGYYKLSITTSGGSTNTNQWWLDVDRLRQDDDELFGPWYGPMTGQTISVFATQTGNGDSGELMAGENTAKSFVYELSKDGIFSDYDPANSVVKAIPVTYKTFHHPLGGPGSLSLNKDIDSMEIELLDVNGTIIIDFHDITGAVKVGSILSVTGGSLLWDAFSWGVNFWSSTSPIRKVIPLSPTLQTRTLAIIVKFNSSTDDFELYGMRIKATEQSEVFG